MKKIYQKNVVKGLVVLAGLFLLSPTAWAEESSADIDWMKFSLLMPGEFGLTYCMPCPTTTTTTPPAPVPKTGQTTSYGTGDDGDLEKGVAWPDPRFTDNGDGTVTDNLTGLIWLKNANCFGIRAWANALTDCNTLNSGECGLTDGSLAGDWRLPNHKELFSLVDAEYYSPALSNTAGTGKWTEGDPFTSVQSTLYWSGTSYAYDPDYAWIVGMYHGNVYYYGKPYYSYVWPVRGGND